MNKKTIILTILIILLTSLVSADYTDEVSYVYQFEETSGVMIDNKSNNNMTIDGGFATRGSAGKNGLSVYNTNVAGFATANSNTGYSGQNATINIWIKDTDLTSAHNHFISSDGGFGRFGILSDLRSTGYFDCAGACEIGGTSTAGVTTSTFADWTMLTITYQKGVGVKHYINGTQVGETETDNNGLDIEDSKHRIGRVSAVATAYYDEYYIWNHTLLNDTQISALYNGGTGFFYPFIEQLNFSSTLVNNYTGTTINNFTIIIGGISYNTTNGTATTTILKSSNQLINITYVNDESTFFNKTFYNVNVSSNHEGNIYQSTITPICYEKVSGDNITCTEKTIYPNAGIQNITISSTGYFNNTKEKTITALDNKTINFTGFYTTNLSMKSIFITGTGTTNCTYTINDLNTTFTENKTTTNTNTTTGLINGTYNIQAECLGYALNNKNITINQTTQTITISLYTTNSVNISFFDSATNALLIKNISIEFIGGTNFNQNTDNGSLYVDLLSPSQYTLIYSSTGYRTGTYVFTLINQSNTQLTLYLDNSSTTSLVLMTVRDKYSKDPIQNAIVTIQRYINNSWITEQIFNTDFNGQGEAWFQISTEFYNFLISKDDTTYFGVINSNENKKVIYAEDVSEGITIEIDLNPNTAISSYQSTYDVATSLNFYNTSNTTGYFQFFWDNSLNTNVDATLNVLKGNVLNCTQSLTSESGTLTCNVVSPLNGLHYFTATGTINGLVKEYEIGVLGVDEAFNFNWGTTGWFITIFLVLIGFTMFLNAPKISIIFGTIIFSFLIFFNVILKGVAGLIIGLLLFIAFLIAKIKRKEGE